MKREDGKKQHLFDILANTLNLPMYRRFRIYVRFEFLRVERVHTICSDSEKTLRTTRNRGNVTKITRMVSDTHLNVGILEGVRTREVFVLIFDGIL